MSNTIKSGMKWYRIKAMMLKYYYLTINSMDRIFDVFYWPTIGLIIFGLTTMYLQSVSDVPALVVYLIGGTMIWALFERVQQDIGVFVLEDFWSRNIANSFVTPIRSDEIFVSLLLFGMIRAVASFTVMATLALVAYHFNIFHGGIASLLFVIPLFLFAWAIGLFVTGMIFRFGTRIQVVAWSITYLLQPFAAVYYPLETLPSSMQAIAHLFPVMYAFEGFRTAYQGTFSNSMFIMALVLSIGYFIIGYVTFTTSIKKARETGFLTKY